MTPVILASKSPYRHKAMSLLGIPFTCEPADIDEATIRDDDPDRMAELISIAKAESVIAHHPETIVIASDLFVHHKAVMEKPGSIDEAKDMLRSLSGQTFSIIAGLAVGKDRQMHSCAVRATMTFRELSEHEINDYVSRYDVLEFAGAFDTDGVNRFAEHIEGAAIFETAMPIDKTIEYLKAFGIDA